MIDSTTPDDGPWPHGDLTPFADDLFFVVGTNRVHHDGALLQTSRTMLVVREGDELVLVNTVRLDEAGLAALDALGRVRDVVRLGAFHGRDDAFYRARYGARLWAVPGSAHADGLAADRELVDGGELPLVGARALVFRSSRHPEAALLLERAGGVLVTCDAVQNWTGIDPYFSPETGAQFEAGGLLRPANVPSTWTHACAPAAADFARLLTLPFRHLVTGHGPPLVDAAHAAVTDGVRRAFPPPALAPRSDRELATARAIAHPPERVFDALRDAAQFARWWGPHGFTSTVETFDVREGGALRLTLHGPDGRDYPNELVFRTVETPRRVVLDHVSKPAYVAELLLEPNGDGTLVRFFQTFPSADACARLAPLAGPANAENLDRLEALLGPPDAAGRGD